VRPRASLDEVANTKIPALDGNKTLVVQLIA